MTLQHQDAYQLAPALVAQFVEETQQAARRETHSLAQTQRLKRGMERGLWALLLVCGVLCLTAFFRDSTKPPQNWMWFFLLAGIIFVGTFPSLQEKVASLLPVAPLPHALWLQCRDQLVQLLTHTPEVFTLAEHIQIAHAAALYHLTEPIFYRQLTHELLHLAASDLLSLPLAEHERLCALVACPSCPQDLRLSLLLTLGTARIPGAEPIAQFLMQNSPSEPEREAALDYLTALGETQ